MKVSFLGLLSDPESIGEEVQEIRISDLTSYIDKILTVGVALKPKEVTRQEARAIKATAAEARRRFDKERVHLYELLGRQRQQIDELTGIHRKVTRDYQNLVEAFAFAAKWSDAATQQELYRLSSAPQLPNEERGVVLARAVRRIDSHPVAWHTGIKAIGPKPSGKINRLVDRTEAESKKNQDRIQHELNRDPISVIVESAKIYDDVRKAQSDPFGEVPLPTDRIENEILNLSRQLSTIQTDLDSFKGRTEIELSVANLTLRKIEANQLTPPAPSVNISDYPVDEASETTRNTRRCRPRCHPSGVRNTTGRYHR